MTLGERIRDLRQKAGLTQEELAKEIGYSTKTSISKIENDVLDINQSTIVALARALKTTPSVLMGWSESIKTTPFPNANEQELIKIYRNVNEDGQDYIMQTARMVEGTERYRKYETVRAASRSVTDKPIEDIKVEKSKIEAALADDSIKTDDDL